MSSQLFFAAEVNLLEPEWVIVNDTVMGGRSNAKVYAREGNMIFAGDLSLENNGGFASVRRLYTVAPQVNPDAVVVLSLIGDGRTYQLRFRSNQNMDGIAYAASFDTEKDKPMEIRLSLSDFRPVFRGRLVRKVQPLAWRDVRQIGIMLADKNPGPFELALVNISWKQPLVLANNKS